MFINWLIFLYWCHKFNLLKINWTIMKNRILVLMAATLFCSISHITLSQSTDFLNGYFANPIPLNNNTFTLSLSKVLMGDLVSNGGGRYSSESQASVVKLPEYLEPTSLSYYGIKQAVITDNIKFNQLIEEKNLDWFNSQLPQIEILKNKLLSLNYKDGKSESFLFTLKKLTENEETNNKRKMLQLELATDDVKTNDDDQKSSDIIWRIFVIGNEAYLALNGFQLNRIHVKMYYAFSDSRSNYGSRRNYNGVEVESSGRFQMIDGSRLDDYGSSGYKSTGQGIYLARDKDEFMDSGYYIDPANMVFLFKLKQ